MPDSATSLNKVLVCVGPDPSAPAVIKAALSKAQERNAKLIAVYVEVPGAAMPFNAQHDHSSDNLRFAEKLGADTFTLTGRDIARSIVDFAHELNIRTIIAGKPRQSRWAGRFRGSPVDGMIRMGGEMDIEIVSGERDGPGEIPFRMKGTGIILHDYGTAVLFLLLATGVCFLMFSYFAPSNLIMVYLLAVTVTAMGCGRGPAIMASALSVLTFDFFFVPPRFTFTVDDAQYIVTFIVMFAVAVAISHLAALMRRQAETARMQEKQAAAMHGLSRRLVSSRSVGRALQTGVEYIGEIFSTPVAVVLPESDGRLAVAAGDPSAVFLKDYTKEMQLARQAFETGETTGMGTSTGGDGNVLYVPMTVADRKLGVFALRPEDPRRLLLPDQRHLLESLVKQIALSLEVEYLIVNCTKPFPAPVRSETGPGTAET